MKWRQHPPHDSSTSTMSRKKKSGLRVECKRQSKKPRAHQTDAPLWLNTPCLAAYHDAAVASGAAAVSPSPLRLAREI